MLKYAEGEVFLTGKISRYHEVTTLLHKCCDHYDASIYYLYADKDVYVYPYTQRESFYLAQWSLKVVLESFYTPKMRVNVFYRVGTRVSFKVRIFKVFSQSVELEITRKSDSSVQILCTPIHCGRDKRGC